jgi:hypothetical protein
MSEIIIYQSPDGKAQLDVRMDNQTVWLSQKQMAELFDKDSDTIGLHLKNIFAEEELEESATTELFSVVQQEGTRNVKRQIRFYNLDAIISVGYRVNSKRGTQFRQWATQRLKDYLVQGYTLNQKRLDELGIMVQLIGQSGTYNHLQLHEAKGLLELLSGYTRSFVLLSQFDSHTMPTEPFNPNITYEIEYTEAKAAITQLKDRLIALKEATALLETKKTTVFRAFWAISYKHLAGNTSIPLSKSRRPICCILSSKITRLAMATSG